MVEKQLLPQPTLRPTWPHTDHTRMARRWAPDPALLTEEGQFPYAGKLALSLLGR